MKKLIKKLFGNLEITWPKLIVFSVIMGIYTALTAMLAPDGNSLHDIAVTAEWWVLPAIIIIVNSKKPLEAALKTFVFFLISQPLVYLIQVPFSYMGWGLFGYYKYWFIVTLFTFPGAFIGWYIKKDKWYSGLILSVMTILLVAMGFNYAAGLIENFPNHLLSIIYCFGIIPIFIFFIFKEKIPRIVTISITTIALIVLFIIGAASKPFEFYTNSFLSENNIELIGEPYISFFSADGQGNVEIIKYDGGYNFKLLGIPGKNYRFSITDEEGNEYNFKYHYEKEQQTVVIEKE